MFVQIIARTREAYFTERFSRENTQLSQEMIDEVNVLLCHYVRTHISDIYLQLQELEHGSPSVWQQLLNVLEVASPQPQASPDEKRKMHIASVVRKLPLNETQYNALTTNPIATMCEWPHSFPAPSRYWCRGCRQGRQCSATPGVR